MPSPITHLAYAQEYLRVHPQVEAAPFYRGTVFPDIRHFAGLKRSKTHQPHSIQLTDVIAEPSAWRAGYMFHNWIDDEWNRIMGATLFDPILALQWGALKLMEDWSVRGRFSQPKQLAERLMEADPEAIKFGVSGTQIEQWGRMVGTELVEGGTVESWRTFATLGLHMDPVKFKLGLAHYQRIRDDEVWRMKLKDCWQEIAIQVAGVSI